ENAQQTRPDTLCGRLNHQGVAIRIDDFLRATAACYHGWQAGGQRLDRRDRKPFRCRGQQKVIELRQEASAVVAEADEVNVIRHAQLSRKVLKFLLQGAVRVPSDDKMNRRM